MWIGPVLINSTVLVSVPLQLWQMPTHTPMSLMQLWSNIPVVIFDTLSPQFRPNTSWQVRPCEYVSVIDPSLCGLGGGRERIFDAL